MIQLPLISYLLFATIQVLHASCPISYSQTHHVLHNHVIGSSTAQTVDQCKQQCASNSECHSINFYESQKKCELNKATHLSNPVDLSFEVLGTYVMYEQRPMNVCSDSVCSTDHICLINDTQKENSDYCKECAQALGMESRAILDSAITSSSHLNSDFSPYKARLNNSEVWCPGSNGIGEYLQIDVGRMVYITKIATQGRPGYVQYVTRYQLKYRQTTSSTWVDYLEGNAVKEFVGNSDSNTVVTHALKEKIRAQFLRIVVLAWEGFTALRVEIYGC